MHLKKTLFSLVGVALAGLGLAAASLATPAAPSNTVVPAITGYVHVGYTLSANAGTWTASPAAKYTYQWQDSATGTSGWANVAGATKSSFAIGWDEDTEFLRVVVTATNSQGSATANSAATGAVGHAAPVASSVPVLSGDDHVGYAAKASTGVWDVNHPNASFKYQWQVCTDKTDATTCADVATGGTSANYTPVAADAGKFLRAKVTASNALKPAQMKVANSLIDQTAIGNAAPSNSAVPTVTATAIGYYVGQTLKTSVGTWDVSVLKHVTYHWQACTSTTTTTCANVAAGGTSSSYKLASADSGKFVRVQVSGDDNQVAHAATASSAVFGTAVATPALPAYTSGGGLDNSTPTVGDVVTFTPGTYTGTPAPTYTYQWYRCASTSTDLAPSGCVAIANAKAAAYTTVAADQGKKIRVAVVAKNFVKTLPARFSSLVPVAAAVTPVAPSYTSGGVLKLNGATYTTGAPADTDILSVVAGTWAGAPAPAFTYQWKACTSAALTTCTSIAGATAATYTVDVTGDSLSGKFLEVVVTGTNATGNASKAFGTDTAVA